MKPNVGNMDRWLRIALGVALLVWAATGGPAWAWLGVIPLLTGLFTFCLLYRLLGIDTCPRA